MVPLATAQEGLLKCLFSGTRMISYHQLSAIYPARSPCVHDHFIASKRDVPSHSQQPRWLPYPSPSQRYPTISQLASSLAATNGLSCRQLLMPLHLQQELLRAAIQHLVLLGQLRHLRCKYQLCRSTAVWRLCRIHGVAFCQLGNPANAHRISGSGKWSHVDHRPRKCQNW